MAADLLGNSMSIRDNIMIPLHSFISSAFDIKMLDLGSANQLKR